MGETEREGRQYWVERKKEGVYITDPERRRYFGVGKQWFWLTGQGNPFDEDVLVPQKIADELSGLARLVRENEIALLKERVKVGIGDLLSFLEACPGETYPIDPESLSIGKSAEELDPEEKKAVEEVILAEFGLTKGKLEKEKIREYESQASEDATVPGKIRIEVFETNKEGVYLQKLTFSDGEIRWVAGADTKI